MPKAVIIGAKRTPVVPKGQELAFYDAYELWALAARNVLSEAGVLPQKVDQVLVGNGIGGGGNMARLASFAAGLEASCPAMTLDSQCCSGLDSVGLAASLIESGAAKIVLCGGAESYSRRPLRATADAGAHGAHGAKGQEIKFYERPPFSPDPERDPDMLEAAAELALMRGYTEQELAAYAVLSHHKATIAQAEGRHNDELVTLPNGQLLQDTYTRELRERAALRSPIVAYGAAGSSLRSAFCAVEADGAAALLVVDEETAQLMKCKSTVRIRAQCRIGGDSKQPGLVPIQAISRLLCEDTNPGQNFYCIELMEAFAAQALACIAPFSFQMDKVNVGGGALARGHPIGASGAILATRLFHELKTAPYQAQGLAAIAAAGGLATAMILERS
ncbi:thiolase family protein [Polycladidibacter stylochi]|uniref:thiolase family protein n=1 Tax=Polycladidibacter stylochi TaxID=1807766 RepID=UPI00082E4DEA|nr:thiolase family protein [Pseudovibrio stylochi]